MPATWSQGERTWLCSVLALAAIGIAGACGGNAVERESPIAAKNGDRTHAAEPAPRSSLVVALRQLPGSLDPLGDLDPWAERIAHDLVFEALVRRGGDEFPFVEPGLADRCVTDDAKAPRTVTCHIPHGIEFHDGQPLRVEDVIYSINYWLDPRREWLNKRNGLVHLRQVEITDGPGEGKDPGRWVKLSFSKPQPLALEKLASIAIVPEHAHRGRSPEFGLEPVGTGPMRVTTLSRDRLVLEAVPRWHRDNRAAPPVERQVYRAVNDGAEALTLLRRGEVQLVPDLAEVHVPVELGKPGMAARFSAYKCSPPHYDLLLYNMGGGVVSGPKLRALLDEAVPRARLEREVYGFLGLHLDAPVDIHEPERIDLEALVDARSGELTKAGLATPWPVSLDASAIASAAVGLDAIDWPMDRGQRRRASGSLRLTVTWDNAPGRATAVFNMVREAWRGLGIVVTQATASWSYLLILMRRGDFEIALLRLSNHSDADLYDAFHSRGEANIAQLRSPALDAALEGYRQAESREARDLAKQRVYDEMASLGVATVLHAPLEVMLIDKKLGGIRFLDDIPVLDELRFE